MLRQDLREIESQNPFNPESEHYGSIRGDTIEANGYPRSAWRWSLVSREWRDVLKDPLWTHLEVKGYHRYVELYDPIVVIRRDGCRDGPHPRTTPS